MNPIISMLNQQNPMMEMLRPIYNAMQYSRNPMDVIGQMASSDNRMQQVMNAIQQNGGIQQAVYAKAQEKNIDPNDVLNQARQMIQTFMMK